MPLDLQYVYDCDCYHTSHISALVLDIVASANFYMCLPIVADGLQKALLNANGTWQCLASRSNTLALCQAAQATRCHELFIQCVRQEVSLKGHGKYCDIDLHEQLAVSVEELGALLPPGEWNPRDVTECIRTSLLKASHRKVGLGYFMDRADYHDEEYRVAIRFTHADAVRTKIPKMPTSPLEMEGRILATNLFNEWLNSTVSGSHEIGSDEDLEEPYYGPKWVLGSVVNTVASLRKAAESANPSAVVGETDAADYACLFGEGNIIEKVGLAKAIRAHLETLIQRAVDKVNNSLCTHISSSAKGCVMIKRENNIHPDHDSDVFACCWLHEDMVTWRDDEEWVINPVPDYDQTPATSKLLQALGIPIASRGKKRTRANANQRRL